MIIDELRISISKNAISVDYARNLFQTLASYGYKAGDCFKANDIGVSGITCYTQSTSRDGRYSFSIDHQETGWYKVDEDTMRKTRINVYRLNYNAQDLLDTFNARYERKVNDKIKRKSEIVADILQQIADLTKKLAELQK